MFEQQKLGYSYDALEPFLDALTMETHYSKHHAAYTKNLNAALENAGIRPDSIEKLLSSLDEISDEAVRKAVRNNGGGFYNHNIYFQSLSPEKHREPVGKLADAIRTQLGGTDSVKEKLSALAVSLFGSGWAWLSANPDGKLQLSSSPNQDNPLMEGKGFVPILAIDVWEHAYYLKYKNLRADYVKAFWEVLDWEKVSESYEKLLKEKTPRISAALPARKRQSGPGGAATAYTQP